MDSTLLEQIRHLCRDRSAYEHLKAILVQQDRVYQLSWEEQYEKLMAAKDLDMQTSDIFNSAIAREKSLAKLADTIQRSPSVELVLPMAVQVAQKILQVDRVAIFRFCADGQGEFVVDESASGVISIADMPEKQISLVHHLIESTKETSTQIVDSIRSSSFSSHVVNLLDQMGISSYVANKIYVEQDVWGCLVACHGSDYHRWSESDRTSLSLIASQISTAISLANLRQQSQNLAADLQTLQIELDNLQQKILRITKEEMPQLVNTKTIDLYLVEDAYGDNFVNEDSTPDKTNSSQDSNE